MSGIIQRRRGSKSKPLLSKGKSQEPDKVEPPLPNSPHVKFSEGAPSLTGTLIDLTKVDPKLAATFLEQLNIF